MPIYAVTRRQTEAERHRFDSALRLLLSEIVRHHGPVRDGGHGHEQ